MIPDRGRLRARTWADVDLDAVTHNVRVLREILPEHVGMMAVVKADAYGHGAIPLAWHLSTLGVRALGVGDSTEALELRAAGISLPTLVLGAIVPGELTDVLRGGIDVTVHSSDRVRSLREAARHAGGEVRVHLKVDTGMGRLGCHPSRALGIAREVEDSEDLHLEGLATHLAQATTSGGAAAEAQLARFAEVVGTLDAARLLPPLRHAYASGAVLSALPDHFNLVRPGLALYGVDPHRQAESALRPALAWRTQVVFLKDHDVGATVGYGATWTATRPSRIGTLPVGYNDGYRFACSNRAEVLIRGTRCPVVGRVSMDYINVDVTHVPDVVVGDIATLLGEDGEASISADTLAAWSGTISHDILCGIGRRVRRHYRGSPTTPEDAV